MLLAFAILGFITTIIWGTFSQTNLIKKRTEAVQERSHSARVALMRLSRELEMAFLSDSENPAIQERRTMFISEAERDIDELRFSWFGRQRLRTDIPEADTSVIMYYGQPDPDDPSVTNLMRRETRRLEAADPRTLPGESYVLCPGVAAAEVLVLRLQEAGVAGGLEHPGASTGCSTCPRTSASRSPSMTRRGASRPTPARPGS